jgi:hypothetical protein
MPNNSSNLKVSTIPMSTRSARRFIGLDAYHPPQDLADGMLTQADNVYLLGKELSVRPGMAGQFTAPFAAPLHARLAYLKADGSTEMILESGGRVYRAAKGASAATEILLPGSGTLASAASRWTRAGRFGCRVDGTAPLLRTDLVNNAVAMSLSAPTTAPVATLAQSLVDPLTGGAWTPDVLTGAGQSNRLPNANFSATVAGGGGWGSGGGIASWTPFGANPDYGTPTNAAGNWLLLDNPGEGMFTTAALASDPVSTDALRYAKNIYAAITCWQSDPTATSTVILSLQVYSDLAGTQLLVETPREFSCPFTGNLTPVTLDTVFSLASLPVEALSFRVKLTAGQKNTSVPGTGGAAALYVSFPAAFPFAPAVTTPVSGGQVQVLQPQQLTYSGGGAPSSSIGVVGFGRGAAGLRLTRDYGVGAPQDWSKNSAVALILARAAGIVGLTLSLVFRQDGSGVRYPTNSFAISVDGTVATCDISTVPLAVRSAFRYVELVFGGDFTVPAANGTSLLWFGPMTGAGNLTLGRASYSWTVTEVQDASATFGQAALVNTLQSNAAPSSNALDAVLIKAQGSVALPAGPTNAAATYYKLWRRGGVFSDGLYRLIATLPTASSLPITASASVQVTWNSGTRTAVDNTPDSALLDAEVLTLGRDAAPVGAQACCFWQGRLWLAKGSRLHGSWLIAQDSQAALYFTAANLPGDPLAAIKGAQFAVGQDDNDPIIALVPLGANQFFAKGFLVIVKQHSVWLLAGTDPSNFSLQSFLVGAGIGGVAGLAAVNVGGSPWFLSEDGIYSFDGNAATNVSLLIEPLLSLAGLLPNAIAQSAMVYHDRRLLFFVPDSLSATPTQTYVYDTRQQGWTHWTAPAGLTSGLSLSSQADSNDLFLAGSDGQLYHLEGNKDKSLPASPGAGIAFAVATRGFGEEQDGISFYQSRKAVRMYAQVKTSAPLAATLRLLNEGGQVWSQPFTFNSSGLLPLDSPRLKLPSVAGVYHQMKITGAATVPVLIKALSLDLVQGRLSQS